MAIPDWVQNFRSRLEDVGWNVEQTKSNHFKVTDPNGKMLLNFSGTPGDNRAMMNALSQAKRAGLLQLETQVKLRREKERLERIQEDRKAGYVESPKVDFPPPMAPNLGVVNGVDIAAIAPAMIKSPLMDKAAPLAGAEELLLVNNQVLYRCAKPAADSRHPEAEGVCHRVFPSAESLRAHITFHNRKPKKEEESQPVKDTATPTASARPTPRALRKTASSVNGTSPAATLSSKVLDLSNTVSKLAAGLQDVVIELSTIKHDLEHLQVADPETIEKAAAFDTIRSVFNK